MKGPMTTQTLIGIIGTEPLHWRADKEDLAAFNGAFVGLLGDDVQLTSTEMAQYTAFVTTLTYPPNPFREVDGSLPTSVPSQNGNPQIGQSAFTTAGLDGVNCVDCHVLPTTKSGEIDGLKLARLVTRCLFDGFISRGAMVDYPAGANEWYVAHGQLFDDGPAAEPS